MKQKTQTPQQIIESFIHLHPSWQIDRMVWEPMHSDLTVFFKNSPEPWGAQEFEPGSPTREALEDLIFVLEEASPTIAGDLKP